MKTPKILLFSLFLGMLVLPLFGQERLPIIDMHLHADLPPDKIDGGAPSLDQNPVKEKVMLPLITRKH